MALEATYCPSAGFKVPEGALERQTVAPVAENTNVVFRICAETKFYSAGDYYCPEKYLEIEE